MGLTPDGDRLVTGRPEGVAAGWAPLVHVVAANGTPRVLRATIAVMWHEDPTPEWYYLRIDSDGSPPHIRPGSSPAAETVGRDQHTQTPRDWHNMVACLHCGTVSSAGWITCPTCGRDLRKRRDDESDNESDAAA